MKTTIATVIFAATLGIAGVALAEADGAHAGGHATAASAQPAALTVGEVRKVDLEQAKVTLKHERIENLDMPPMTMVFKAAHPQLLKDIKPGDKVRFRAESIGSAIVVTDLTASN